MHRSVQISWRTVYNLYIKKQAEVSGRNGQGRRQGREGRVEKVEDDDWMDAIEK
jgi:hypothetical protein